MAEGEGRAGLAHDARGWTRRMVAVFALVWTAALAISLALTVTHHRREVQALARSEARANLDKDLAIRLWATAHGGVYVPVSADTPPSPYLAHVPERDVVTPSGRRLTLMNSAYVTRQIHELYGELSGVRGHVTSLDLKNPANAPDSWERAALHRFQAGEREVSAVEDMEGQPYLRMMRAMMMEEGCLKCHADSGVKVGEVRGGVSVSVPLAPYAALTRRTLVGDGAIYGGLWLMGTAVIGVFGLHLGRLAEQRDAAQRILALSEDRYRRMVETASEGVWVLDRDGVTVYANTVLGDMLGIPSELVVGRPIRDFLAVDNPPGVMEALSTPGPGPRRVELRLQQPARGPFEVMVSATPMVDSGGQRLLCMVTDISGLKRGEERLMELVAQLSASNAELEGFARVTTHDLQEPVRSIVSFAQLLERRYAASLDAEGREFLGFVVAGARRMYDLVGDLAAYTRLGTGEAFRPVDGRHAAEGAVANLRARIEEAGAEVEVGRLPVVRGDPAQLVLLLQNLISNAVTFRRPDVAPKVRVDAALRDGKVEFVVADNGIGIDPAYHDEVFGLFRRLHAGSDYPGTGIGLATCKRIVERHGGQIWIESEAGRGCEVHFTLPAGRET